MTDVIALISNLVFFPLWLIKEMVLNVQFCCKIGILSNYKQGVWCMWLQLSVTHSFLFRQAQAFLQTASWLLWVDSCRGTNPSYIITFFPQEGFFSSKVFLYKFLNIWDGSFLRPQILGLLSNIPVIPSSRESCLGTFSISSVRLGQNPNSPFDLLLFNYSLSPKMKC